ncbi:hypothetical protein L9F63_002095, partial [Diploptera punctata]
NVKVEIKLEREDQTEYAGTEHESFPGSNQTNLEATFVAVKDEIKDFDIEEQITENLAYQSEESHTRMSTPNQNTETNVDLKRKCLKCSVCSKSFSYKNHLYTHFRVHNNEKPFKCTICNKSFSQRGTLNRHLSVHSNDKPFKCTFCNKDNEKPFKCSICTKSFSHKDSGSLNRHFLVHSTERPFKCSFCTMAFSNKTYLTKHLRTDHVKYLVHKLK